MICLTVATAVRRTVTQKLFVSGLSILFHFQFNISFLLYFYYFTGDNDALQVANPGPAEDGRPHGIEWFGMNKINYQKIDPIFDRFCVTVRWLERHHKLQLQKEGKRRWIT
jgi:hypothetical protein